jgi:hypothetical protein
MKRLIINKSKKKKKTDSFFKFLQKLIKAEFLINPPSTRG